MYHGNPNFDQINNEQKQQRQPLMTSAQQESQRRNMGVMPQQLQPPPPPRSTAAASSSSSNRIMDGYHIATVPPNVPFTNTGGYYNNNNNNNSNKNSYYGQQSSSSSVVVTDQTVAAAVAHPDPIPQQQPWQQQQQQQQEQVSSSPSSPIHQRRHNVVPATMASSSSSTYPSSSSPTAAATPQQYSTNNTNYYSSHNNSEVRNNSHNNKNVTMKSSYPYNTMIALLWIPCWCCIYWKFLPSTSTGTSTTTNGMLPIHIYLFSGLLIYGIDLANLHRTYPLVVVWIITVIQLILNVWFQLLHLDVGTSDDGMIHTVLFSTGIHSLFYIVSACWYTIQCQWLIPTTTKPEVMDDTNRSTAGSHRNGSLDVAHYDDSGGNYDRNCTFRQLEAIVHGILPPVFSALMTFSISNVWSSSLGVDATTILTPYLFLLWMTIAMLVVGALPSTLQSSHHTILDTTTTTTTTDHDNHKSHSPTTNMYDSNYYCIPPAIARGHVRLYIVLPGIIHFMNCWSRIVHPNVTRDDVYDFVLTLTVPYIILVAVIQSLHTSNILPSPYGTILTNHHQLQQQYVPKMREKITLAVIVLLASWSVQQRYLVSICHSFSYHYFGTQISTWQCTMYLSLSTILLQAIIYVWGKTSPMTNQLLFGEYHEDIVQLILAAFGLCFGKAFGMPWSMTPLPILGILGFIFWINTRMLRYLSIVLFVVHSVGIVTFTYRFVGIDQKLSLPLPKIEMSLVRFGMLLTVLSVAIGLITGLSVRSSGGYMASLLKRLDIVGLLTILYTLLLMVLEITLLKRPVPMKELTGVENIDDDIDETLYNVPKVFLTSFVMITIVLFMKRIRILHEWSAAVVLSLSMGKAIAVYTYATQSALGIGNRHTHDKLGTNIVYRALIATILCATMFVPRVFLQPIRLKNSIRSRRSSNIAGRVSGTTIPPHAARLIGLYAFVFVPVSLIATLPYVVFPFINAVRADFTQTSYYSSLPPISELTGAAIALWGLALLSMLQHFLPDGGGVAWKKLASLAFLMGLGVYFAAPTIGLGIGSAMYNPYAQMSSVGQQLITRGKIRTGGWGIISAAMATLLAASGPLELKERVYSSGRKDKYLLLRTMIFCFLFGGGAAWFIVLQCMSESEWILVFITVLGAMVLAFLGTVAAVLGYFLDLDSFDDIEQVAKTWLYGLIAFFPITGIPHFLYSDVPHWFGPGGWLTPYLGIGSITSLFFALSLLYRQNKDGRTKGLGNTACVISWLLSLDILYGRNGISGLEPSFDASTILGIPISVVGTIALSTILLALDGESSSSSRTRGGGRATVTTSHRNRNAFWRLNFNQLVRKNQWFPSFAGSFATLMIATTYAIFLRGSGLLPFFGPLRTSGDAIGKELGSHSDETEFLSELVRKALDQSMDTAAQLDRAGFWTAANVFSPTLHLFGAASIVPSFILLQQQYWLSKPVKSFQVMFALPFNAIPILFCRSIPSLTAAAVLTLACALMQLMGRQRSEHASRMRI